MGLWRRVYHPSPAPPGFSEGRTVPEPSANIWKRLTFGWVTPLLFVGFSRPLQSDDLWVLDDARSVSGTTDAILAEYDRRCAQLQPATSPEADSKRREGILLSSWHAVMWKRFWFAGILKLLSDAIAVTSPLITNAFLKFLGLAYVHARAPFLVPAPAVGSGFGLAVGLVLMQLAAAIFENHYQHVIMNVGMLSRSVAGAMVFRKSLRISGKARLEHTRGQITTMLSEDTTRLETAIYTIHHIWIAPIQLIVGIALLIKTLKVSALVGLGVLILSFPIQGILLFGIFGAVRANIRTVDQRVRIMQEVLVGIRSVKMYAWERFYQHKIAELRTQELSMVRKFSIGIAGLIAVTTLTPIASSTLSFITYALLGKNLDPAIVFSALQLFNIIRLPLLLLPVASSSAVEGQVALTRVVKFLSAEELSPTPEGDHDGDTAVTVKGSFTWEADMEEIRAIERKAREEAEKTKEQLMAEKMDAGKEKARLAKEKAAKEKEVKRRKKAGLPPLEDEEDIEKGKDSDKESDDDKKQAFMLQDLQLEVPRGSFVAIVGRVGCGKSSLLQAIGGEMRPTNGTVNLAGSMSLVPQAPWIVNATFRDNIIFGEPVDEERYQAVVRACALQPDLAALSSGDQTELGERGVSISGGQKARVCLARAVYAQSDILLLDDPLSAVDAHVSRALVDDCLSAASARFMAGRTRILVTHQLHVLPRVDYIFLMAGGRIAEQGSYAELMARPNGELARLVADYGSQHKERGLQAGAQPDAMAELALPTSVATLMQDEDRELGQVRFATYKRYFVAAGGISWMPWILFLVVIGEGLHVGNQLALGWWSGQTIRGWTHNQYIALYSGIGIGTVIISFLLAFSLCLASLNAAKTLFDGALDRVMRSPVAFFDTTPLGRMVNRLTKDVNVIDKELAFIFFSLISGVGTVFGTVALVFYTMPYLGVMFAPLAILYTTSFLFYRRNSVEVKRLDSILRSSVFSTFIETLAGISTVRATRQENRFVQRVEKAMDVQNRAHYMNIVIARWLNMRLNFFASILILGITLFAAGRREHVNPANVGLVLTYVIAVMAYLAEIVAQFAQLEQSLNGVERLLAYTDLPSEGTGYDAKEPPSNWPSGSVEFKNVVMAYRVGLPDVLNDLSFAVKAGEKVGVVGRTGAGKSSIVQVMLRMFEIKSGSVELDGIDTRTVSLRTLRERMSVIPQDSICHGTVRETIDPMATRTDAELLSILQRAHLLPPAGASDPNAENKFSLDATVGSDGATLSAGERQQLALCRVLVKQSSIVILDEATSSVDVETDAKLQATIRQELASSTLLVIAHRLNTIIGFDRILVMDGGRCVEFDTPLALWENASSTFRSLCEEASVDRDAILRARPTA